MVRSFFNRGNRREKINIRNTSQQPKDNFSLNISKTLQTNIDNLNNMLDTPDDLKIRELEIGKANIKCAIAHIEGIVDAKTVQLSILNNLENAQNLPVEPQALLNYIYNKLISVNDVQKGTTLDEVSLPL